jgi:hypothetical protein
MGEVMKSLYDQKADKCRHFNGTINGTCKAGVAYATVKVSRGEGKGFALPCLKDPEGLHCDKLSFKSHDEITAEIEEVNRRFENIGKARAAIVDHCGGPWKRGMGGTSGVIDCPACGGSKTLHFSRAGYNGHVHAGCETANCVRWME